MADWSDCDEQPHSWGQVRRGLVERSLYIPEELDVETRQRLNNSNSLRKKLLDDITDAAMSHARAIDATMDAFEGELAPAGIAIVDGLQDGLTESVWGFHEHWNFWEHDKGALDRVMNGEQPWMDREHLERIASDYLKLPYRAQHVERILVDIFVAIEMYAYGHEVITVGKEMEKFSPGISPLHQPHAVVSYLKMQFWSAAILVGLALIVGNFLSDSLGIEVTGWVVSLLLGLFVVVLVYDTAKLPLNWRRQKKARKDVHDLMMTLVRTYSELASDGTVSTRRLREVVSSAADSGVVWPGTLFALLDDNISRSGRL